jgi:(2Fe-2S) ferredoxin
MATSTKTPRMHMMMCFGTACLSSGAESVKAALVEQLEVQGVKDEVNVIETGCNGFCAGGPLLVVYPGGVFYNRVGAEDTAEIVSEHVIKGRPRRPASPCSRTSRSLPGRICAFCATRAGSRPTASTSTSPATATPLSPRPSAR